MTKIGAKTMTKILSALCLSALCLSALCFGVHAAPPSPTLPVTSAALALSDVLDREIGTGHVLKVTLKNGAWELVTMQGRSETHFFASRIHFANYFVPSGGINGGQAPADIYIQIGKETGYSFPTQDMTDTDAVAMLETNPARFRQTKAFVYYADKLTLTPADVMRLEWLRLPGSALRTPPLPVQVRKPVRVNPRLNNLWP